MHPYTRRRFLSLGRVLAAGGAVSSFSRLGLINARAQTNDYKALVAVFLFGGNDSNNTIVPVSEQYDQYAAARGVAALGRTDLLPVFTQTAELGLHPNLAPLQSIWNSSDLAVVANVGTLIQPLTQEQYLDGLGPRPVNLFSHSNQQKQWQTASPQEQLVTGWGGQTADRIQQMNAPAEFPAALSLAGTSIMLAGDTSEHASVSPGAAGSLLGSEGTPIAEARTLAMQRLWDFPSGLAMVREADRTLKEGVHVGKLIDSALALQPPLQTVFTETRLGAQLKQVARLIQARGDLGMRRQIFFCAATGYDTHSGLLPHHVVLLSELGDAMAAFHQAMQEIGVYDRVTLFTESEFGRTLEPNANRGCDHGWGSHQFVMGGAVAGGKLYGEFPQLIPGGPDDVDDRGRWIPKLSLDQLGATLAHWFGLSESDLNAVFPNLANFSQRDLGFLT